MLQKKWILALAMSLMASIASAELCTIDQIPAATLLIPYFEVDVSPEACADRGLGVQTLFSVNNASAAPTIAHVTLWTNWSVHTLDFDIYLTGYDVQTVNLWEIFCEGNLPATGFAVSNEGPYSAPNVAFPNCNNTTTPGGAPVFEDGVIASIPGLLEHLKAAHTGSSSPSTGRCSASATSLATGYITIDQTTDCSTAVLTDPGYYTSGILGFENQLWGDYFYVNPAEDFAQGNGAIAIEAFGASVGIQPTFYGRYNGTSGIDRREPLATTWASRFAIGGSFDGDDLIVWREGNSDGDEVDCGTAPTWWPLSTDNQTGAGPILIFNEEEDVFVIPPPPISCPPEICNPEEEVLIPDETQALEMGIDIPTSGFEFGWIYLNLQHYKTEYGQGYYGQSHVSTRWLNATKFSVLWNGIQLDSACSPMLINPGN